MDLALTVDKRMPFFEKHGAPIEVTNGYKLTITNSGTNAVSLSCYAPPSLANQVKVLCDQIKCDSMESLTVWIEYLNSFEKTVEQYRFTIGYSYKLGISYNQYIKQIGNLNDFYAESPAQ